MITLQIRDTEKAAIEVLKPALETALDEAEIELRVPQSYTGVRGFYDHNLKINKIAYAAIQEFELPLIRTWYRYGQYEPYDELRPKSLDIGQNIKNAYVPSKLKTDVTQENVTEYLLGRDLKSTFEKDTFEFLIDNYKEWKPKPYTNAYIASTNIIEVLDRINGESEDEILRQISDLRNQFKQASLDLRYEIKSLPTFSNELHGHIKAFLYNLEDALVNVDENSDISEEQWSTFTQGRTVYHEYVWPWAALNISLDKAEGPKDSLESFSDDGRTMLRTEKKSYQTHLTGWETDLKNVGLKSQLGSHKEIKQPAPKAIQQLQKAAHDRS